MVHGYAMTFRDHIQPPDRDNWQSYGSWLRSAQLQATFEGSWGFIHLPESRDHHQKAIMIPRKSDDVAMFIETPPVHATLVSLGTIATPMTTIRFEARPSPFFALVAGKGLMQVWAELADFPELPEHYPLAMMVYGRGELTVYQERGK